MDKYSTEKLNTFSKSELVGMMVLLQDQMCQMNDNDPYDIKGKPEHTNYM